MRLNTYGKIVADDWQNLSKFHSHIDVDTFVVMPNHLHGILVLHNVGDQQTSVTEIIGRFKSFSAKAINRLRDSQGIAVWQRNYYEKIIRNEEMLNAIREYILQNPTKWVEDTENPMGRDMR